jgi:hypothetical protein
MSNMTTYSKGELIKHLFRSGSMTKPSALYVALFVGGTEVSGGGYARVAHGPSDSTWADQTSGDGRTANIGAITFPSPTASWGVVTACKIMDASTGGNALASGNLAAAKTVNNGDPAPTFADGVLVVVFS